MSTFQVDQSATASNSVSIDDYMARLSSSVSATPPASMEPGEVAGSLEVLTQYVERILSSTVEQDVLQSQTKILTDACQADTELAEKTFKTNFLALLYDSDFEFGYETPADEYVRDALEEYDTFACSWINELFLDQFESARVTSSLLRVIAHFDYDRLYPQGMTIAMAAMTHPDVFVRECGIRCFENWEAPENLPLLKTIALEDSWLKKYAEMVITDLESIVE